MWVWEPFIVVFQTFQIEGIEGREIGAADIYTNDSARFAAMNESVT